MSVRQVFTIGMGDVVELVSSGGKAPFVARIISFDRDRRRVKVCGATLTSMVSAWKTRPIGVRSLPAATACRCPAVFSQGWDGGMT